jgi:hypothetical protein
MSRFCRHNRFIERCPICRETVPGLAPETKPAPPVRARPEGRGNPARRAGAPGKRGPGVHVSHERRAEDDGYRSPLVPGLRSSQDAARLAEEIAFAAGRLVALGTAPPDVYGQARARGDVEQALWTCFLGVYLCPLEGPDPFAGVRRAVGAQWRSGELPDLDSIPLGPRTSHDPARGDATVRAYRQWAARAGSQAAAFAGDPAWTPARRFARVFERLTLPGFARAARYELLVTVGRLGLCEVCADALHFGGAGGGAHADLATVAAKRVFGIGDPLHLEPRALELASAAAVPVEALDLALANWGTGERATWGVPAGAADEQALERARAALEL